MPVYVRGGMLKYETVYHTRYQTRWTCDKQFHNLAHLRTHTQTRTYRLKFKLRVCIHYLELQCLCNHEFYCLNFNITI